MAITPPQSGSDADARSCQSGPQISACSSPCNNMDTPSCPHYLPQVRKAIDSAPHLAGDAVELGLVDGALFRDQAVKVAQRLAAANTARLAVRAGEGRGKGMLWAAELQRDIDLPGPLWSVQEVPACLLPTILTQAAVAAARLPALKADAAPAPAAGPAGAELLAQVRFL